MGEKAEKAKAERRAYNFEIRAEENDGSKIIAGRPIVYNSITDLGFFDEVIEAGALNETDLRDVRFLVNHDTSKIPLARSRRNNGNSTMKLTPDAEGLLLDWVKLDVENNSEARSLYSAVSRGDISGMSFMFYVDDEEWENLESEHPLRRIKKIGSVVEISAVTFPAYGDTEIYTRSGATLENVRAALENARKRSVEKTVDTVIHATSEIELLKAKIKLYGGK